MRSGLGPIASSMATSWMTSASRSCSSTIPGTCRPSPSAILRPARPPIGFEAAWVAHRGLSHALCCRAEAASDVHATWFRKALDAGVRMALGSDIRPLKEAALLEMGLWVRDGATPWQTLVAATRHGAEVCGVGAELGTALRNAAPLVARLGRACLPASVVGFFDGAVQPHLDQMQHAPINDTARHRL